MVDDTAYSWLRWIPLLPLFAAAVHGLTLGVLRRPLPRAATITLSCSAPALAFVVSLVALVRLAALPEGNRILVDDLFTWIAAGDFGAELALLFDPLSSVMALLVSGVGTVVHVAAIGLVADDTRDDRGFNRFFAYLNLAMFSMLTLVLAENLLVFFLGWQGVGLCTFLLLGFWYSDERATRFSMQAFVLARVGDVGFLAGTFLLYHGLADVGVAGTSFFEIAAGFGDLADQVIALPLVLGGEWPLPAAIAGCFALAAVARGAQWPLHFWLPGAVSAPAPVPAMTLAITGASAGIFLLCRLPFVFASAPGVMATLAWLGAITAVLASLASLLQTDLRKVLVALTGVQLGWMFVAAGSGALSAALFHAVTTAFFMPLLFLAAGSVLRAARGEADLHHLGGLWDYLHRTKWLFLVGLLALAGVPVSAGFYSRDGILLAANVTELIARNGVLYLSVLGTVGIVGFVAMRLHVRIFLGRCRLPAGVRSQIAESDGAILGPLYGLAFLAALGGFLGPSAALNPFKVEEAASNSFANFLAPLLGTGIVVPPDSTEIWLSVLAFFVSATGAALAWYVIHERPELSAQVRQAVPLGDLGRRIGVAPIYDHGIVRPALWMFDRVLRRGLEAGVIDTGIVRGSVRAVRGLATGVLRRAHSGLARGALLWMMLGALAIASYLVG